MRTLGLAMVVAMAAGAARAHEAGVHVHPHGTEGWMALGVGLMVLAGFVAWRQK